MSGSKSFAYYTNTTKNAYSSWVEYGFSVIEWTRSGYVSHTHPRVDTEHSWSATVVKGRRWSSLSSSMLNLSLGILAPDIPSVSPILSLPSHMKIFLTDNYLCVYSLEEFHWHGENCSLIPNVKVPSSLQRSWGGLGISELRDMVRNLTTVWQQWGRKQAIEEVKIKFYVERTGIHNRSFHQKVWVSVVVWGGQAKKLAHPSLLTVLCSHRRISIQL